MIRTLLAAGIMMAFASLSPAQSLASPRINNIVLVHGAFSDGSSWAEVIARLQNKGYRVSAVQNPLTSLADDVAATRRVVERQDGDVLLVGHSWAGVVVTEAGNAPKVKALAYLSAIVPDSGESAADFLTRRNAPMDGLTPDANGLLWLDGPEQYRAVMAHDVPLEKVKILAATQQPIAASAFAQKVGTAAWRSRPSWYLMTEDDHALPLAVQRWTIEHIGANNISLRSSHMSMISSPQDVADFIDQAARGSAVQ